MKNKLDGFRDSIVDEYNSNERTNCSLLAKKYGVSKSSIRKLLLKRSVTIRNDVSKVQIKSNIKSDYFKDIGDENTAYFLGLLSADGSISSVGYCVSISLQSGDADILDRLRIELNYDKPLKVRKRSLKNANWKDMCQLSFKNKEMATDLISHGCVRKKTHLLKFPYSISQELIKHWLRGMSDGNGHIGYGRGKHIKIQSRFSLVATNSVCNSIKTMLFDMLGVHCSVSRPNKNGCDEVKRLMIAGNIQVLKFLDWLYDGSHIYLQRKYNKYQEIKSILTENKINESV